MARTPTPATATQVMPPAANPAAIPAPPPAADPAPTPTPPAPPISDEQLQPGPNNGLRDMIEAALDARAQRCEARALLAFGEYEADDLVKADADTIDALERDGKVDAHPDAVAFAKSLLDD